MEDLDEDLARYNEKPGKISFFHDLLHKLDKIITLLKYGRLSRGNLYNEHYTSIIAWRPSTKLYYTTTLTHIIYQGLIKNKSPIFTISTIFKIF